MDPTENLLRAIVTSLVDHPDRVEISRTVDEMGVLLTLGLHPDDMGKVIGRAGNTAKAIRTILRVSGMKHNARVNLKVLEPVGGKHYQKDSSVDDVIADLKA